MSVTIVHSLTIRGLTQKSISRFMHMLAFKFLCNVNDTRALIGLSLLVTSHLGQIPDPWRRRTFTLAHIVIGLSLHVNSFIHLRALIYSSCQLLQGVLWYLSLVLQKYSSEAQQHILVCPIKNI